MVTAAGVRIRYIVVCALAAIGDVDFGDYFAVPYGRVVSFSPVLRSGRKGISVDSSLIAVGTGQPRRRARRESAEALLSSGAHTDFLSRNRRRIRLCGVRRGVGLFLAFLCVDFGLRRAWLTML